MCCSERINSGLEILVFWMAWLISSREKSARCKLTLRKLSYFVLGNLAESFPGGLYARIEALCEFCPSLGKINIGQSRLEFRPMLHCGRVWVGSDSAVLYIYMLLILYITGTLINTLATDILYADLASSARSAAGEMTATITDMSAAKLAPCPLISIIILAVILAASERLAGLPGPPCKGNFIPQLLPPLRHPSSS